MQGTKHRGPMKCRTCKSALSEKSNHGPFCSERCKMNDLSKWFSETYGIEALDDDGAESSSEPGFARDETSE